jgi:hypothetical protein
LLDRLEADNFKKSIRATLSPEEKLLLEMETQERDSLVHMLDEMKSEGIPSDLIPKPAAVATTITQVVADSQSIAEIV